MHALADLPDDVQLPPLHDLLGGKPDSWQGLAVEWSSAGDPIPIFLQRFVLDPAIAWYSYVFGARYSLSDALVDGAPLGDGYFVEYFVVEGAAVGDWVLHRLLQRQSVTFSERDEIADYVSATEVTNPATLSLAAPPNWDASEAVWPTVGRTPMLFVGQVHLPETEVTRELLTWGVNVYLFWMRMNDDDVFKIVQQEADFQSAEEHYAAE